MSTVFEIKNTSNNCFICNSNSTSYLIYECIHRPSVKDRKMFGYIGRKCYIKIHICDCHRSHVISKMKNRIVVSSDIQSFKDECQTILLER
jgi:hypothetical protein